MLTVRPIVVSDITQVPMSDPFWFAVPCWKYRPDLPPEERRISISEVNNFMAIRTVAVSEAPQRQRGSRLTVNQDVNDVLDAINNPANKGKAIIVTMSDPSWTAVKNGQPIYAKPETAFAYYLRRRFAADKLGIIAYTSGKMEVTVRAMTSAELNDAKNPKTRNRK